MDPTRSAEALLKRAEPKPKGRLYEDFREGQVFEHHWGRTITESDCTLFTTLTCNSNPLYFNRPFAQAHGYPDLVANPLLVFNTVFGLSVEDLSEIGGPFVGVDDLVYGVPVHPGDTLLATSTTVECRLSKSNPDVGLVTWHTRGVNQHQQNVIEFRRTNIVRCRSAGRKTP